ncbi:metallophosphoesterase family protein, partial [Shigella sonnei]
GTADRNRSHWSTSKTPSYTKSVSWQHHPIAHADYPGDEYQFGKEIAESELLWPVDRVQKSLNGELQQINGADYFIFGHMMFDNIQTFANQIYIDTGTPKSGRLSFYKIK